MAQQYSLFRNCLDCDNSKQRDVKYWQEACADLQRENAQLKKDVKELANMGSEDLHKRLECEKQLKESLALLHLANDRCNELARELGEAQAENQTLQKALGKTYNKLADEQQYKKSLNKSFDDAMKGWDKTIDALNEDEKKLEVIRELCKNTLRINRGLPIDMLDDGYLLDSDTLAQRILEVLSVLNVTNQEDDGV